MRLTNTISVTCVLWASMSVSADVEPIPLDESEMLSTIGGVTATIYTPEPGARLLDDELIVRGAVWNYSEKTMETITVDAGNGKSLDFYVDTSVNNGQINYGFFEAVILYPLDGPPTDLTVKSCNTGEYVPCQNVIHTVANIDLDPRLKVGRVWFHHIEDNGQKTSTNKFLPFFVDYPSRLAVAGNYPEEYYNTDEFFKQCNPDYPMQFRTKDMDTVDASEWYPESHNYTTVDGGAANSDSIIGFRDYVSTIDPFKEFFHVFIVNNIYNSTAGEPMGLSLEASNIIFLKSSFINENSFNEANRVLAHELGHSLYIDDQTYGCYHDPNERNIMCWEGPDGVGKVFDVDQCEDMYAAFPSIRNGNK